MIITVGNKDYELSTKLGVAKSLETKFKMPLSRIFSHVEEAELPELLSMLSIATGNFNNQELEADIYDNWGYIDLQGAVQELLANMMFAGTPEQMEAKIDKYPVPAEQKNAIREMLRLPLIET